MRYYQFEFGVDGYVSLGSRYGWVLTINQLYPYLPFIFRSRARNGRFKKVFSCFVFNFFIEVLKTHVVLDYLNPAYQAAARPASFTRVFRAYYLGQSYLTVGFLFDRSAIRRLAGWTKMDPSQAEPKEISFPFTLHFIFISHFQDFPYIQNFPYFPFIPYYPCFSLHSLFILYSPYFL